MRRRRESAMGVMETRRWVPGGRPLARARTVGRIGYGEKAVSEAQRTACSLRESMILEGRRVTVEEDELSFLNSSETQSSSVAALPSPPSAPGTKNPYRRTSQAMPIETECTSMLQAVAWEEV